MRILFVATKCPWPAVDGGRLLVANTIEALAARGHRVTLVAPSPPSSPTSPDANPGLPEGCALRRVAARPRSLAASVVLATLRGRATSVVRHTLPAVRREVDRLLSGGAFDVVHAEQLQALAQAEPAFARRVPVVLRAQNVESDLWTGTAAARRRFAALARREARRLVKSEGEAVDRVHAAVALTAEDARRLSALSKLARRVRVVRAPFAPALPSAGASFEGYPALVVLGSEGWLPNRDAVDWFVGSIWPAVREVLPEARLHVFGLARKAAPAGVDLHAPATDSRELFAQGSVLVVPLRIGSGVRMKILEAWARGVPVVASPQAVRGLEAEDGRDLLVARDADGFVRALRRLHDAPGLASRLVVGGRASLAERHDPEKVTEELVAVYQSVAAR